jgi:MFS family permease
MIPLWRSRTIQLLVAGQCVSTVGDSIFAVALPWYIISHNGNAILLTLAVMAYGIPRAAMIVVGGQLSDKYGSRRVMVGTDVVRAVLVGLLGVIAAGSELNVPIVILISCGIGASEGLFLPASFALMPTLVREEQFAAGNGLLFAATRLAAFAGPAIGGLVVGSGGAALAFSLDAATFAFSGLTLWRLGAYGATAEAGRRTQAHIAPVGAGTNTSEQASAPGSFLSFLRRERVLWYLMSIFVLSNVAVGGIDTVALPIFSHDALGLDSLGYGAVLACLGGGEFVGSLLAARLSGGRRPNMTSALSFLVCAFTVLALAQVTLFVAACVLLSLCGVLLAYGNVISQTAIQRWTPTEFLGRVSGLVLASSFGTLPIAAAFAGGLVEKWGSQTYFVVAGSIFGVVQVFALSLRSVRNFGLSKVNV